MALTFSTKRKTLSALETKLTTAAIPKICFVSHGEWRSRGNGALSPDIRGSRTDNWIVRSSAKSEDGESSSKAGAYLSVLNAGTAELAGAIDRVFASYGEVSDDDEVIIQPMLENVVRAGVVFSHDPNSCAPYRVINWTEGTSTTTVTSGRGGRTWHQAARSRFKVPAQLKPIMLMLDQLLALFPGHALDCEFGVTSEGGTEKLWLLQVRRLVLPAQPETEETQETRLAAVERRIERELKRPHPNLLGRRTVYGVMPDWNPAEIIGIRPRPLALSLYRDLVTDSIWAYQRHNYGYRNLRSFPLMPHFWGLPYIDVRLSFNSFIPSDLDDDLAEKLVNYYVDCLIAEPALHDKVEFEIVFSCYSLDLRDRLAALPAAAFSEVDKDKITHSLRRLTNRVLNRERGLWQQDAKKIDVLRSRRERLLCSDLDDVEKIYWLLEDAKRYGTLPFAGLARAAFIAVQILKSFVAAGLFSEDDRQRFLGSVSTVSGQMAADQASMTKSQFLERYGHLRPGTYDLLSSRYDEKPDVYFDWAAQREAPQATARFELPEQQEKQLDSALSAHGLEVGAKDMLGFIRSAIEWRELSKFYFSQNLSDALKLMGKIGDRLGIPRDLMSFADVSAFRELYVGSGDQQHALMQSINLGKVQYEQGLRLVLPPLIRDVEDVWSFEWPDAEPNFITQLEVLAPVADSVERNSISGAVVFIPSADPGYDWLFAYPIAGLVTAWGGANSHMAIRAGELGLPAVVGAGEVKFRAWSKAKKLHIDCAARRVEIIQ